MISGDITDITPNKQNERNLSSSSLWSLLLFEIIKKLRTLHDMENNQKDSLRLVITTLLANMNQYKKKFISFAIYLRMKAKLFGWNIKRQKLSFFLFAARLELIYTHKLMLFLRESGTTN